MPGVGQNVLSDTMALSRLSPEIPRLDIHEEIEPDAEIMASNLFGMFGSSSSTQHHNQEEYEPDAPKMSLLQLNGREIEADEDQIAAAAADSFQFLRHSIFMGAAAQTPDGEAHRDLYHHHHQELQQPSTSSVEIELPITRLWTNGSGHDYDVNYDTGQQQDQLDSQQQNQEICDPVASTPPTANLLRRPKSYRASRSGTNSYMETTTTVASKPRRKRSRPSKSSEEVESQRMTHIAVERNRRKQMNEHLRVLRSLMPGSYVQRGDQASIIGGAIEFVKELQQLLQCLEERQKRKMSTFSEMLVPPRLPSTATSHNQEFPYGCYRPPPLPPPSDLDVKYLDSGIYDPMMMMKELYGEAKSEFADVEVKISGMVASIKILSQRKRGQLLKTMTALEHNLYFTILQTNVTTIEQTVLYSFEAKISPECTLTVDGIAAFIHETLATYHPEQLEQ